MADVLAEPVISWPVGTVPVSEVEGVVDVAPAAVTTIAAFSVLSTPAVAETTSAVDVTSAAVDSVGGVMDETWMVHR